MRRPRAAGPALRAMLIGVSRESTAAGARPERHGAPLCRVLFSLARSGIRHAPVHRYGAVPDSEDRILEGVSQKEERVY